MSDLVEKAKHLLLREEQCHVCKKWFPAGLDDMTEDKDGNHYLTCEKCLQEWLTESALSSWPAEDS